MSGLGLLLSVEKLSKLKGNKGGNGMSKMIPKWELDEDADQATMHFIDEATGKEVASVLCDYKANKISTTGDMAQVLEFRNEDSLTQFKQALYSYGRTLFS